MKNLRIIICLGLLAGSFSSCEDLEIDPQQSLSTELAFADKQAVEGSLLGVYSLSQEFEVFGSLPQVIADFQSDNVDFIGSFPTLQDVRLYATQSDNATIRDLWRRHYQAILAANAVIQFTPESPDESLTQEERAQFVAEAKFMRALLMFQMVNLFAQPIQVGGETAPGIPIVTEPFTGEIVGYPRSTVGEVHAFILDDLTSAVDDLPVSYEAANFTRGRATQGAANALLSRVYLYRGEWQLAADRAEDVLENESLYELASNYNFWGENNSEYVFSIQNSEIDNGRTGSGGWASYYNPAEDGARGDAPFSVYLLDAYGASDRRLTELSKEGDNERIYTTKFPDPVNHSDNSPIIRTTEVVLNRAEALAQLDGVNQESLDLVNDLRVRAGLDEVAAADFSGKEDFVDFILEERRKELAFEGHRRMDLLRYGRALRPQGDEQYEASQAGQNKTILPIPQRELDINPELVQNDGYN
ncbi:RagB/SusD family nutrient uptake outer membrane protein [Cyclobacterium jeungdonense]|uniref:RagB/SusD family nutrient uptake outer membrane protein n=1 Tax=Cyclobacterium jeungdonense TaxID=708087 RepID=A0ABT8C361_9BACT|nr:RagB/SusD family nutrient uptake outer membrane protein [Cyclobacterium jeungdonense]MDN3687146.1 RagB/SusD family nutrient uptake outer membrane protein [Cyclobacterium jeungdonense]